MSNPYVIGSPVLKNQFFGRNTIIKEILEGNDKLFCLFGQRRVGKTSLLKKIEELFSIENQKIAIYLSLQGDKDSFAMGRSLFKAIRRKQRDHSLLKQFAIPDPNLDIEFYTVIELWIDFCNDHSIISMLLIDEAEELIQLHEHALSNLRRALVDHNHEHSVIITGTRKIRDLAQKIVSTSSFLSAFNQIYLDLLDDDAATLLITQNHQILIEEQALKEIKTKCGGHPYFIQFCCYKIFKDNQLSFPENEIWILHNIVFEILSHEFQNLKDLEKSILLSLYFEKPTHYSELADKINTTKTELDKWLDELTKIGLLRGTQKDCYQLNDIFWELFLASKRPLSIYIYHHKDDEYYLKELKKHLKRTGILIQDETTVQPGQDIEATRQEAKAMASLILVLLSPSLIADPQLWDECLAIQRSKDQGKHLIPILARPCGWNDELGNIKILPKNKEPLSKQDMDDALNEITNTIINIIQNMQK